MQHSRPTLSFKPFILLPPTLHFLPLHPRHRLMFLAVFLYLLLLLFPPPRSLRALHRNAAGLRASRTNYYTLCFLILLTLSVCKNPILIHLLFSRSLDSLLCDLIASTPGLAFSCDATYANGGVFIFVRQGQSLSKHSTSSLSSLDSYSDYVGANISLNNFSASFLNVYTHPIRSSSKNRRTESFALSYFPSSRNLLTSNAITPLELKRYF